MSGQPELLYLVVGNRQKEVWLKYACQQGVYLCRPVKALFLVYLPMELKGQYT